MWRVEFPGEVNDIKTPAGTAFKALKEFFGRESRMDDLLQELYRNQLLLNEVLKTNAKRSVRR